MKYSVCERLVWLSMSGAVFSFLKHSCPGLPDMAWKRRAKARYQEIIAQLPEIGGITQNPFRASLSGGALWMAVYETSKGAMDEKTFGDMVIATLNSPLMRKKYASQRPFSLRWQRKQRAVLKRACAISDSPFNWHSELILGHDADEYRMAFRRCGLCALGKKLGHPELVPYMCRIDYLTIGLMGGVLRRSQTLAEGGDCCDFYICKKGSKWDQP